MAALRAQPKGLGVAVKDIFSAIKEMPKPLRQLALVYLFQWYALFIYWQFSTLSIAKSVQWAEIPEGKTAFDLAVYSKQNMQVEPKISSLLLVKKVSWPWLQVQMSCVSRHL